MATDECFGLRIGVENSNLSPIGFVPLDERQMVRERLISIVSCSIFEDHDQSDMEILIVDFPVQISDPRPSVQADDSLR